MHSTTKRFYVIFSCFLAFFFFQPVLTTYSVSEIGNARLFNTVSLPSIPLLWTVYTSSYPSIFIPFNLFFLFYFLFHPQFFISSPFTSFSIHLHLHSIPILRLTSFPFIPCPYSIHLYRPFHFNNVSSFLPHFLLFPSLFVFLELPRISSDFFFLTSFLFILSTPLLFPFIFLADNGLGGHSIIKSL